MVAAGEPGVGKSRLVAELGRQLDRSTDLVTWRQGRCLPYGEGVSFWALGEIVKAHAGILESDTAEDAAAKLDPVVPEDEPDRQWLRQRLAPLVGAGAPPAAGREELYDRHPAWAATGRNVTRIDLAPLSTEDTAELVSSMFGEAVPDAEVQRSILERAGGNPLFAEELVRMLKEQGLVVTRDRAVALADGAEVAFPESIQALIAARLDLVTPERKRVLQDGAVIGRVFWSGAVAAMGAATTSR